MAGKRSVYHVMPNSNGYWVVSRESDSRFREEYANKERAVEAAVFRALADEPSHVKVHRRNGHMEYENTYGDPRSSSG